MANKTIRLAVLVAICAGVLTACHQRPAVRADAGAPKLVVLGGSIAAGYGLAPRPSHCGRSSASFGNRIARSKHFRFVQMACASALSGQVIHGQPHKQVSQLSLAAGNVANNVVIVGPLGGNDVNWLGEEHVCLLHGCGALRGHDPDIDNAVYDAHLRVLGVNLKKIFRTLEHEHARKIIVDEYYAVTQRDSRCLYQRRAVTGATHKFDKADFRFLTVRLAALNATIAASAPAGVTVVKPNFAGHGVCAADPWVAVRGFDNGADMHPTDAGQAALARFNEADLS